MDQNNNNESNKLVSQALIFKQKGDLTNAELNLKEAIKLDPNNFIGLNNMGSIYSIKNEPQKAKNYF